jgi:hypothetical protein
MQRHSLSNQLGAYPHLICQYKKSDKKTVESCFPQFSGHSICSVLLIPAALTLPRFLFQ